VATWFEKCAVGTAQGEHADQRDECGEVSGRALKKSADHYCNDASEVVNMQVSFFREIYEQEVAREFWTHFAE
jgi:hypothetical protein